VVFAIRSPDVFLSQRQYLDDVTSLDEDYCTTIEDNTHSLFYFNAICNMTLPFLLNFIPAVVILVLNLTLWATPDHSALLPVLHLLLVHEFAEQLSRNKLYSYNSGHHVSFLQPESLSQLYYLHTVSSGLSRGVLRLSG